MTKSIKRTSYFFNVINMLLIFPQFFDDSYNAGFTNFWKFIICFCTELTLCSFTSVSTLVVQSSNSKIFDASTTLSLSIGFSSAMAVTIFSWCLELMMSTKEKYQQQWIEQRQSQKEKSQQQRQKINKDKKDKRKQRQTS